MPQLLLDAGASPTARDQNGMSCVHHAALHGDSAVIPVLVDLRFIPAAKRVHAPHRPQRVEIPRANIGREFHLSADAVEVAVPVYSRDKIMSSHGGRCPRGPLQGKSLTIHSLSTHYSLTDVVLSGEDVEERRPLHLACTSGHLDCISEILKRCASPNFQDSKGRSALHAAIEAAPRLGEESVLGLVELILNPR